MNCRTVVDLFCGCGGLTLGAHKAGFETLLAVDKDAVLSSSFKVNFPSTPLVHMDLARAPARTLSKKLNGLRPTAVIGGPPCQGFSVMGRREKGDPRNGLLRAFFKCVAAIRPSFFLMENVPGLLEPSHRRRLDSALEVVSDRYTILDPVILNAASFGAATKRARLIVVGYDKNEMEAVSLDRLTNSQWPATTVRDAISDLPGPVAEGEWATYPRVRSLSGYARHMRTTRPLNTFAEIGQDARVSGCQMTVHKPEVIGRFEKLEPGKKEPVSKFPRLRWDAPALVLRAGTGNDRGSYQAARPIHPDEPRVITVREAARLQGFPDWFQFHPTKWHSHRMIGNSVSPIFAEAVLSEIARALPRAPMLEAAE